MITFKSFKVANGLDDMNMFMKEHPPLPTKEGMAITFQDGYAVMWYEDGEFNEVAMYRSSIEHAIVESKHNLVSKKIALPTAEDELYRLIPKHVYDEINADKQAGIKLIEWFKAKGLAHKQAEEMAKLAVDLDQKRWLAEKEIDRVENIMLPHLEKLLQDKTK